MSTASGRGRTPPLSVHAWLRYSVVQSLLSEISARTALEIGVGQGSVGVLLARRFAYTGIDLDQVALARARDRFSRCGVDSSALLLGGLERVQGQQFDLVCAFEVLEHLEDDVAALSEWCSHVVPGGHVLLSVPADPRRFGKADEKAGHFRRYTRESLLGVLRMCGLVNPRLFNYGFPIGYVLETGRNLFARRYLRTDSTYEERTLASGRWLQPPDGAARLTEVIARPLCRLQRPFVGHELGTGLVVLAERTSSGRASGQV